ncbi:DUF354 domain-containing protein [Halalkalicoccus jeotgali]|uniref:DUF354 domain-containing protein n=1 Tax=Halalkalicoccus jeotgali (strain DSM 18796 / CECT 7217 / JCM 14584 / KCTC 4019 / B3) TaxID=795797 RepID=D8J756_HALJB|nr:DUF354 domain-containing protein [Halalkalicoccus jeotgali]ADJ13951.1 hypothetical protein HacjB3_02790 [Halalkalicoccus jeotgali B3]ELY34006.1 hypothetical protein C497_16532 [Halalkalicoccus jeotgali B3]
MKIIFTIQHPAHVHLFRNAIQKLKEDGHQVHVYARNKDIAIDLLEAYDIDHTVLAGDADRLSKLALVQAKYELRLAWEAWRIKPDVIVAMGEPAVAHVAKLVGARSLIFTDTEIGTLQNKLAFPLADRIYTPECYQGDIGPKQVRYPGYHELAYLHPDRFTPDPSVVEELEIDPDEKFVVLRLVAWNAAHDVGHGGFSDPKEVVDKLEATGARVLITAENGIADELDSYKIDIPPEKIHHVLYYADLFVGESATMATESAVLGTPAIFVSSTRRGYTDELEDKYGMVFTYSDNDRHVRGIEKAIELLQQPSTDRWEQRRDTILDEKIDTTNLILEQSTT